MCGSLGGATGRTGLVLWGVDRKASDRRRSQESRKRGYCAGEPSDDGERMDGGSGRNCGALHFQLAGSEAEKGMT